jgi:hypothetical protein
LHGVVVATQSADAELAAFLEPILAPLAAAGPAPEDWSIGLELRAEVQPTPPGAAVVWDGTLPEGIAATLSDDGDGRHFVAPGRFHMTLPRSARAVNISVTTEGRAAPGGMAAFWLIDHLLAVHDRHLLHGACLIAPAADGALALFAPSGTGKTTTALALARAGFALAGDDALVLRNTDQGALMWAVPRRLRVHRKTAAMMPWLEPSLGEWSGDEQAVSRESLSGVVGVAGPTLSRAVGIVVLRPPNANGHHIERIGKAEAVSHIVADNVRRAPMGVEPHAQAAFAAIARFVARTPAVALSVGPDPNSLDPTAILSALR